MEDVRAASTTSSGSEDVHAFQGNEDSQTFDHSPSVYESSMSSSSSPRSRSRLRRTKRSAGRDPECQLGRRKRYHSSTYHSLLNHSIKGLQLDPVWAGRADLYPGQVGVSRWSPVEKEMLYRGIVRHGRHNLPAIAALIATKSQLEVHLYLELLQESKVKLHMYGARQSLISMADIPAAVEVSEQCCNALEQAADSLALLQQRDEQLQERKRHTDLWRLNHDVAGVIDRRKSEGENGVAEIHEKLPAAEVLNLGSFLDLSAKFFMNSSEPDSNFRSFAFRSEKPSILHTAFSDLYSIAMSTTKRITQASLFFAMSRLRATKSLSYSHKRAVKRADVLAALKVLGMKENADAFWARVPKSCRLNVYDHTEPTGSDKPMDYEQVERFLTPKNRPAARPSSSASESGEQSPEPAFNDGSLIDVDSQPATASLADVEEERDNPSDRSSPTSIPAGPENNYAKRTDEYIEHIDEEASRREELLLWQMLGKEPPQSLSVQESAPNLKNPGSYRQTKDDMEDWTGWTDFRPEWEAYGIEALKKNLANNRRKIRTRAAKLAKASRREVNPSSHNNTNLPQSPGVSDAFKAEAMSNSDYNSANDGEHLERN
ncbi:MAG: hypothetical protein LQ338_007917 [Usnochroma carphineum]|nr:MAG: hypothetical protein LQ338_007917 [Usnochroma carphineum]